MRWAASGSEHDASGLRIQVLGVGHDASKVEPQVSGGARRLSDVQRWASPTTLPGVGHRASGLGAGRQAFRVGCQASDVVS
jgi:hypothetical protein